MEKKVRSLHVESKYAFALTSIPGNRNLLIIHALGAQPENNYDSAGKGGNRYATILLYMTDLEKGAGGETAFLNAKSLEANGPTYKNALKDLRASEQGALFQENSWEEKLVAKCRSSLAIRPNSARAVLFYSQLPNGKPDPASLHGGCPVVAETPKWAANLWVWNTPVSQSQSALMSPITLPLLTIPLASFVATWLCRCSPE
jgi:2OG-Fe(II) oxygenase superfamily